MPRDGRFDKACDEGLGGEGFGFELRMELHRHKPRVVGQFDDLNKVPRRARPGDLHSGIHELLALGGVEFIAVAVAFADLGRSIAVLGT